MSAGQLKDPNGTRVVKTLPLPPQKPLSKEDIFEDGKINWRIIKSHLKKEGRISQKEFHPILLSALSILSTSLEK
jgi:hypothetical protein